MKTYCYYCAHEYGKVHTIDKDCLYNYLPDRVASEEEIKGHVKSYLTRKYKELAAIKKAIKICECSIKDEFGEEFAKSLNHKGRKQDK